MVTEIFSWLRRSSRRHGDFTVEMEMLRGCSCGYADVSMVKMFPYLRRCSRCYVDVPVHMEMFPYLGKCYLIYEDVPEAT